MRPLLELCDASFAYTPGQWALRNVSLSVTQGECLALLGANGAGKSTLLMLLAGAEEPCHGQLRTDGQPVVYRGETLKQLRRSSGILLQDPDDQLLAPTVEHDVALAPLEHGASTGEARRLALRALRAMGVEHLASRPVHDLSLGEKKRVALAGLIVMKPRVLLLDEPTAGLDPAGVRALLASLEELRLTGTAIVQATHDVNLAFEWADSACLLNQGRVLCSGDAADVLSDGSLLDQAGLDLPLALQSVSHLRRSVR